MRRPLACVHGTPVNETCVCDLLWQGDFCQIRDCQSGEFRDGICHCHLRHAGEFCEYQACYHKDVLYCWGLKDTGFSPCNASAIGGHVDPETVKNPAWYCPCGEGRRTPPPQSQCVCNEGYKGEFCSQRICDASRCSSSMTIGRSTNNHESGGILVPDSVKVAMVCMSMVVLVALIVWLKKICFKRRTIDPEPPDSRDPTFRGRIRERHHPLTPSQLNATLLMLQTRDDYVSQVCQNGRVTFRTVTRLPSYEEANAAPPSYATVILAQKKASLASVKNSTPGHTVVDQTSTSAVNQSFEEKKIESRRRSL